MDVTCERCRTSYDFDETLVGKGGTTVKCTSCGHLFKVFPSSSAAANGGWRVRRSSGAIEEIASLRDLQQRIVRGDLIESDAISRAGQAWKPLGAIDELRGFFRQARASEPPPAGRSTLPFAAGAPPVDDEATRRVSIAEIEQAVRPDAATQVRPRPKQTLFGVGGQGPGIPTPAPGRMPPPPPRSVPPPPPPSTSMADAPTVRDIDPPGRSSIGGGPASTAPSRPSALERSEAPMRIAPPATRSTPPAPPPPPPSSRAEGRASVPTHLEAPASKRAPATPRTSAPPARPNRPRLRLDVDEGAAVDVEVDSIDLPKRPIWPWVALVVLGSLGGVAAWKWGWIVDRVATFQQGDAAAGDLSRGEEALARHDRASFVQALDAFGAASSAAPTDPRVHEALSRAHAAFAQTLAFESNDLAARSLNDPSMEEAIARLRREQADHVTQARAAAQEAVRLAPDRKAAKLALADALRLAGEVPAAKDALANADRLAGSDDAYAHLVRAGIAIADAGGDVTAGRAEAERAATLDPSSIAARLLLARVLLAAGDVSRARDEIDAVLAARSGHSAATDLADAIARGIPPAPPVVQVLDGGVASAADAGAMAVGPIAVTPTPAAPAPTPVAGRPSAAPAPVAAAAPAAGAAPPPGRDYGWYVERGDELLERGNIGQARAYFEAALGVRASGAEALTGLGYVALNGGDAAGAVRRFEPASRSGYSDALIGLGDAYRRLGRNAEALRAYQQYLERRPTGPQATIAQRQVDALRASSGGAAENPPPAEATPAPPTPPAAEPPPAEAPPTPPDELPAPRDTPPSSPPPSSDPPAIGTE